MTKRKPKEEHLPDGRPQKYTPESILQKALEYFNSLNDPKNFIDKGIQGKHPRPKTLSGLCLFLGVSKDYISEKAKDPLFSEAIKRIRLVVENNIEEWILLNLYNPASGIFNLKNNFQWTDKQEIDMNVDNNINYKDIPTPQLLEMLNKNLWK